MNLISSSLTNKWTLNKWKLVKNVNLFEYPSEIEELNKWTIHKVSPKEIYKIGMLDFKLSITI